MMLLIFFSLIALTAIAWALFLAWVLFFQVPRRVRTLGTPKNPLPPAPPRPRHHHEPTQPWPRSTT